MFRTTLCAVVLSAISFVSNAVETLDVLVVFDQNTVTDLDDFNTSRKRLDYARLLISNMNNTLANSGLANKIQFRLENQLLTAYTGYSGGKRENLKQIWDRYQSNFQHV